MQGEVRGVTPVIWRCQHGSSRRAHRRAPGAAGAGKRGGRCSTSSAACGWDWRGLLERLAAGAGGA
eukprot:12080066-Alexandrium_andersonii.AAC.1